MHNVLDAYISITKEGVGPEIREFLGPVKWHRADRREPFGGQKTRDGGGGVGGGTARGPRWTGENKRGGGA